MRALITTADGVELSDAPEPTPRHNQALVAVEAFSLNRGEIGALASAPAGRVWGWDAAGTVRHAAADGSGPAVGTRVVGLALPPGAWAELAAIDTSRLAEIPDDVAATAASTLPVAGLTALYALDLNGSLLGRRVLITGSTGGVGRYAIQLARRGGAAQITAVVRDPENSADLLELGAHHLVTTIDPDGPAEDIVVESLGGPTLAAAIRRVGLGGILVTLGDTSREPITFSAFDLYPNGSRIHALRVFLEVNARGTGPRDLAYLASGLADGWLDPQIDRVAPWEQASEIIGLLIDRKISGKAVLTIGG